MKKVFFICFLCCWIWSCWSIEPPQLRCLSVDNAGGVTLTWLPLTNTDNFLRYEIYYSNSITGPFSLVGQVTNASTTTYTHSTANALVQAQCYYYVATCSSTQSLPSDTLCTIEFYLSNYGNGIAVLNWREMRHPSLPSSSSSYDILRAYPANHWITAGSSASLIFRDTIDVCNATLTYRIELADASGCRSISRPMSDVFSDRFPPDMPQLDSVSVNYNNSRIQLGWERSMASDVFGYIIYHSENGLWIPVDTIYGADHTFWEDLNNSAEGNHQYTVAAIDTCYNTSTMTEPQHNFHVQVTFDECRREAYLVWDEYENLPPDIEKYAIYYTQNGGPLQFAGEVNATTFSYTLSGLVPQTSYECIVKAVNLGNNIRTSSSKCSFFFDVEEDHDFIYIATVSVENNQYISIKVATTGTSNYTAIHLYRSINDEAHFTLINQDFNTSSDIHFFIDKKVEVDKNMYYYQAILVNECNIETQHSNISHNILLTGHSLNDDMHTNQLLWRPYEGWQGAIANYTVYRKTEIEPTFTPLLSIQSEMYTDQVYELRRSGEGFSYYVEAEEMLDEYGFSEISRSNTVVLNQLPLTYVPNAFAPSGSMENAIFLPVHSFVTMYNYHLYVYGRDGILLFHTTNPNMGWNGGYNGNLMPAGCYVYKITYSYGTDGLYEKVGTVTLIR